MRYKNKIVLITGSGSGIGKAAALAFSKEGGKIIVSDINEDNGLKTVSEIIKNKGDRKEGYLDYYPVRNCFLNRTFSYPF